ncbi:MAG TPA: cytochrome c3 family protein [Myxococcales bacterium]
MKKALAVALAAAGALALVLAVAWASPAAAPAQPVPYSHKVHAGDYQIGCLACHVQAERSPVAGIPSMQRCAGCHKFAGKDKPAVQAVMKAVEDEKPLEWVRVYRLPDHVYFTHERHVAAKLACQECHGPVQAMEAVRQEAPLTMGWCLGCHEKKQASRDCWTCHK